MRTVAVVLASMALVNAKNESARILRMGMHGTINHQEVVRLEGCPTTFGAFQYAMVGEKTDPMMRFNPIDPGNPTHVFYLNFTPEDIAQYYRDAAAYFLERFGVDFSTAIKSPVCLNGYQYMLSFAQYQMDICQLQMTAEGAFYIDNWQMAPRRVDFNNRMVYTSDIGLYDCPRQMGDESMYDSCQIYLCYFIL
jgi:hypothetical protein